MKNVTALMDRSHSRVPSCPPFVQSARVVPPPGTPVFYTGKEFSGKIGISSGRIGIVDGPSIPGSGAVAVSFERLPKKAKPGEEIVEDVTDKAPEGFILNPDNLRPVPAAALAKREEQRRAVAASKAL